MKYSCYYIIHLGCFMGFTMHFYITFGTNLLTQSPVPVPVFSLVSVFRRKGISNGVETEWNLLEKLFLEGKQPDRLGVHVRKETREPRGRGAPSTLVGPSWPPLTYFFLLYIPIYPKTFGEQNRSGVPPLQASVATKNLSGARSSTLPEGGSLTGGHLHHPGALHDEEGVVHPRGWGYVPVAMCLISLSLVFLRWYDLDVSRALLL